MPDPDLSDAELAREIAEAECSEFVAYHISMIDTLVEDQDLKWELISDWANRRFEDSHSSKEWLKMIRDQFHAVLDRKL